jgi:hypothetical protein
MPFHFVGLLLVLIGLIKLNNRSGDIEFKLGQHRQRASTLSEWLTTVRLLLFYRCSIFIHRQMQVMEKNHKLRSWIVKNTTLQDYVWTATTRKRTGETMQELREQRASTMLTARKVSCG